MKKILFAAMALGMTMTSCMNDEFPNAARYGYINLNVSNDPIVETRAVEINGKKWIVTIGETEYTGSSQAFNAGTYNVSVKTHEDVSKAIGEGTAWGEAYYDNSTNNDEITVEAGTTVSKVITCGKAKNTRLTVEFTDQFTSVFPTYQLNVTSPKTLTFNADNNESTEKYAYFEAEDEIEFTITYKKENQETATTTKAKKLTLGGAGFEKIISVTANTAGNIELKISTENFEGTTGEEITFDAATGTEITE